jgi:hypothetical protein
LDYKFTLNYIYIQAAQRYLSFTPIRVHRCTRTRILSGFLATDLDAQTVTVSHYEYCTQIGSYIHTQNLHRPTSCILLCSSYSLVTMSVTHSLELIENWLPNINRVALYSLRATRTENFASTVEMCLSNHCNILQRNLSVRTNMTDISPRALKLFKSMSDSRLLMLLVITTFIYLTISP